MKSDTLIQDLVLDLEPVRRLPAAGARALCWGSLAAFSVATFVWALGMRADVRLELREGFFVRETATLFVVFVLAGFSAFQLSVPNASEQRWTRLLPLLGLGAWLVLIVARFVTHSRGGVDLAGVSCVWRMLGLSLLPTLVCFSMLRGAAPFDREWVSLMAFLSASALAVLGTQFVCAKDNGAHVLFWHFSPLLVMVLVGASVGKRLLAARQLGSTKVTQPQR